MEKSQVNVFFIILNSIVLPQESGQFSSRRINFAILEFLLSRV
jgi:hypothetical protein